MFLFKRSYLIILLFFVTIATFAQQPFFTDAPEASFHDTTQARKIIPNSYRTLLLNKQALLNFLQTVPLKSAGASQRFVIEIPMPHKGSETFYISETPVIAPGLQAQHPDIKTYSGYGITDPSATIKIDITEFGFHSMILSPVTGSVFIDPYAQGTTTYYISYYRKDLVRTDPFYELGPIHIPGYITPLVNPDNVLSGPCRGTQLNSYRLAVACTHQYAIAATGLATPTVAQTLAKIVTTVNRVVGVYEKELSVTMMLVATENNVIFTTAAGDPFTNNSDPNTMIGQSQTVIDNAIGIANYDIGHAFSTGSGGLADLGVICNASFKAMGTTGITNPTGDAFDIDYVAHEMGHQFGGDHTFNSVTSNCGGGNRNASTAYEVGSATTIMGYAGICGTDDIQPDSDPYFHAISFDEISNYLQSGGGCATITSTGDHLPQITAMNNGGASIPLSTPFILTGTATDVDGDPLTYSWEEWDLGTSGAWNNGAASTTAPLFKARVPKSTGSRMFPDISVILAGYPSAPAATMGGLKGETLPTVARTMKFRLTVRDNRGGVVSGGSGCQSGFTSAFQISTAAGTGPFIVTAPNGGEVWGGNTTQTVTWNIAGTASAPINCSTVSIQLSYDGGLTYPVTLLANTPNDGSQTVTLPSTPSIAARIRVMAVNNVFFDISNNNFTITDPFVSKVNGNWNDPNTWLGLVVPGASDAATVKHLVTVTANASCYSLTVVPPSGNVVVNTGVLLNITH